MPTKRFINKCISALCLTTALCAPLVYAVINGESNISVQRETLSNTTFKGGKTISLNVGIGSGAFRVPNQASNEIYTITDRGPNIGCEETEKLLSVKEFCLKNGVVDTAAKVFPIPTFTPTIYKISLSTKADASRGDYTILEKIPLKDKAGNPITGLPNPLKATDTEGAYDANAAEIPFDVNGLDTEAIVRLNDGTFWVGEEYGPSLVHVAADGKIVERVVPAGVEVDLATAGYTVSGKLPAIWKKRKLNRGIESVALSPDQQFLYTIMQSPLANPNDDAYKSSRNVRLLKIKLNNGSFGEIVGEYVYEMDKPETFPTDASTKQNDVKVSELVAFDTDKLIVLERITKQTKLYRIDLAGATNIFKTTWDELTTSPSLETANLGTAAITPVVKTLVFNSTRDLSNLAAKIESVALLDSEYVALINDNDFGIADEKTEIRVVRLTRQLTEFDPSVKLVGRAVLPAATFADGPTSGAALLPSAANGQTVPFVNKQPVQGFSGLVDNKDGTFWGMLDNGFGSIENSADFNLRVYKIRPNFRTVSSGTGEIAVESFIELKDPNKLVPFAITNHFTTDRVLTGADFDIESIQRAPDGTLWFGDEFGPFLLHTDANGVLLDAPIPVPDLDNAGKDLRTPQNPFNEEATAIRIMNAVRAHARVRGNTRTPVFSPYHVMLKYDASGVKSSPDTHYARGSNPQEGLVKAAGDIFSIASMRSAGYPVVTWTINDKPRMLEVMKAGVTGIISDRPDLLLEAVKEFDADGDGKAGDLLTADGLIDYAKFDAQGHRGGRNLRPENTLPAMEVALDYLMTTLELDTGITKDNVVILKHDPYIENVKCRRADGSAYEAKDQVLIKDFSAAEIQSTFICDKLFRGADQKNDAALSPVSVAFAAQAKLSHIYAMPTLQQVFDFVKFYITYYETGAGKGDANAALRVKNAKQVRYNIETKINPRSDKDAILQKVYKERTVGADVMADAVANVIVSNKLEAVADIQSFDFRTLLRVQEKFPAIRTVYLFGDFPIYNSPDSDDSTNMQDEAGKNTPWMAGLYWPYRSTVVNNPFRVLNSGGLEGMAMTPDGKKLITLMEKPLVGGELHVLLMHEFDIATKKFTGVIHRYPLEKAAASIGDFTLFSDTTGLILERDNSQREPTGFKRVYKVQLNGDRQLVSKQLAVNLNHLTDTDKISEFFKQQGDVGLGTTFTFPFVTIENILVLGNNRIAVMNDNNFPFSLGRNPILPDNNEFIVLEVPSSVLTAGISLNTADIPVLPNVAGLNREGKPFTPKSSFKGGISVAGQPLNRVGKPRLSDKVSVRGMINVDPDHVGKKGELIVVGAYRTGFMTNPLYYMLNANNQVQAWDGNVNNLVGMKSGVTLQNQQDMTLYEGNFVAGGELKIYFGYRLEDGNIIFNADPIDIEVIDPQQSTSFRTTLIHINDHHSHLPEEDFDLSIDGVTTRVKLGGIARVGERIKRLRSVAENPLVLHAGDAVQGTLYYTLFKGDADVEMMNLIGFDALVYGNHEFDDGNANLARLSKTMQFPIVSANIDYSNSKDTLSTVVKPYIIKEIAGEKVGIMGLTTTETPNISSPGTDITFLNEVESARRTVQTLEAQGVNKIIALTHIGYTNDLRIATQVEGIDVIVGGHSHTLLGDFSALGLTSGGNYPTVLNSPRNEPVCVVQAWHYNYVVGNLRVGFNPQGKVTECNGTPTLVIHDSFQRLNAQNVREPVSAGVKAEILKTLSNIPTISVIPNDAAITEKLKVYTDKLKAQSETVIGTASADLLHARVPGKHSSGVDLPNGSLIAPVVSEGFLQQLNSRNYKVDMVIQNAGGVRVDLPKGNITIGTAYTLLPFANTIVVLELTGAEVKQVLEDAISNYADKGGGVGSFPYGAGVRYTITAKNPMNQRVSNVEVRDATGKYVAIDPAKTYRIGTNSFVATGRDGYTTFGTVSQQRGLTDTFFDYAESFVNYVREVKTLNPPAETGVTYIP